MSEPSLNSMKSVNINDVFWSKYQALVREVVIPFQWEAISDTNPEIEPTHTLRNFRIAAGEAEGEFQGMRFQDSDVAKWLETVGFTLAQKRDPEVEKIADEVIELIGRAQFSDGYLNTYFTVAEPGKRWTNLHNDHELYCAGHMIEAAVAYYEATGKSKLLEIVCRFADHIAKVFGSNNGQIRGYDAHPEIELALVKLYQVTGKRQYLELSKFFIEERGKPNLHFFDVEAEQNPNKEVRNPDKDYSQAHRPVRKQETAEGHAVRAMYLYSGVADIALEYDDEELYRVCRKIWNNVVKKRMYVTGGIGSQAYGERFTLDYDLPNDRAYTETCAAIGLVFWAQRMLKLDPQQEYADVLERALYNCVLSGMSLDGKKYFYVNPLEVWPEACDHRYDLRHVKYNRQSWFVCACCPPNISRLLASLGQYIYTQRGDELFVHLFIGNEAMFDVGGRFVQINQESKFPQEENTSIRISLHDETAFTLAVRLPSWCKAPQFFINGERIRVQPIVESGYAKLRRVWKNGDEVIVQTPMEVLKITSHPSVRENVGKVALQRGPFIYCLEEIDNGCHLPNLILPKNSQLSVHLEDGLLEGVPVITGTGWRSDVSAWEDHLYQPMDKVKENYIPVTIKAIPYYLWNNRGEGEMLTWIRTE